jgi:hypothetical protein
MCYLTLRVVSPPRLLLAVAALRRVPAYNYSGGNCEIPIYCAFRLMIKTHEIMNVSIIAIYSLLISIYYLLIDTWQISRMSKLCPGNLNLVRYLRD